MSKMSDQNIAKLEKEPDCKQCNDNGCQECCEHAEQDHFICLDCGYEGEPSDWYDEDAGQDR